MLRAALAPWGDLYNPQHPTSPMNGDYDVHQIAAMEWDGPERGKRMRGNPDTNPEKENQPPSLNSNLFSQQYWASLCSPLPSMLPSGARN